MQTEFLTLAQQPDTSISVYKKKFDDVYKSYLEAGGAKMSEVQVVILFSDIVRCASTLRISAN